MLVEALLSLLPEEIAPAVIVVKPERPTPSSRSTNSRADPNQPKYDPSMIFVLELATVLTLRDTMTLETLGENLATTLQTLVRDAKNLHPLTVSRVVSYLLNLLRLSHVCSCLSDPIFLVCFFGLTILGSTIYASTRRAPCYFWI